MPPKPKGLKASKRAAPAAPAAAVAGPALNEERTMPLDEDALTVADLFELAARVLEILYPFSTSLRFEPVDVATGIDDARNLLRGVLHGCDVLDPYVYDRRADMHQDKLDALGLGTVDLARTHLRYLQAFALRHLGELFEPHSQSAPAAAVAGVGASKRRKVDLREPQTAQEWFDAADERLAPRSLPDPVMAVLVAAERVHLAAVSADLADDLDPRTAALVAALGTLAPDAAVSPTTADVTDAWYASLRALTAAVVARERAAAAVEPDALPSSPLLDLDALRAPRTPSAVLAWLSDAVRADELLSRFEVAEDWIEAHYRADADDNEEEGDNVAAFPDDAAADVAVVRQLGQDAITALRQTISSLPSEGTHPSAKTAQYRKLEEALLLSSALVDPADDAELDRIEAEVERVRQDGALVDTSAESAPAQIA